MYIKKFVKCALAIPAAISIMVKGETGIGKSDGVKLVADTLKLPLYDCRISQMTEGDIIGLPSVDGGITKFNPPNWFKRGCDEAYVIFLDELNRGTPEVIQAVFQIALDRRMGDFNLHPDTRIFAAINEGNSYQVNELDPALMQRFWTVDFVLDNDEWLAWATESKRIHQNIVDFLRSDQTFINKQPGEPYDPKKVYRSPRSWTRLSDTLVKADIADKPLDELFYSLCVGFVGDEAASRFKKHVMDNGKNVTAEEILNEYKKVEKTLEKYTAESMAIIAEKIVPIVKEKKLEPDQVKNLARWMRTLGGEMLAKVWTDIMSAGNVPNITALQPVITGYVLLNLDKPMGNAKFFGPDGEDPSEWLTKYRNRVGTQIGAKFEGSPIAAKPEKAA